MEKPNYYLQVYEIVQLIPPGRVCTYGAIADYLTLGSARMVGWALRNIKGAIDVPAHRVVNKKGELSGRASFNLPSLMQALLACEGIEVVDDKVVDFERLFWHPEDIDKI